MGAARHRSQLISALLLAMLSAVCPPAARAQQSVEAFRQSLLALAATLDAQAGSGGSLGLQQDVQEASPEAIEFIQQELAKQGSPNAVEEVLRDLTPPPHVSALSALSTTSADVDVTEICADARANMGPPLACPLATTKPANCPADAPFPISKVLALQISVQTFDVVAIAADTICSFHASFLNVFTKTIIAIACTVGGVTHGIINGLEISLGLNNICGGGEKEADLQASLLASLAVGTGRVRKAEEAAGRAQAVADREIEIALRNQTKFASLQLPVQIETCPLAAECVRTGQTTPCQPGIYPQDCNCKSNPSISCTHRLDCATATKICAKPCQSASDCGPGVACLTLPTGTRICDQAATPACTTDATCTNPAAPSCIVNEVGGQLDAVVDLVQRRLQQAQAAGRNIASALGDFNTARETICQNNYPAAFGFLEKTYTGLSNF